MDSNFKNIHIGQMIEQRVVESGIEISRICNFLKIQEDHILKIYESNSQDSHTLLKLSKLLEYDFFRIYSHHLILYAPPSSLLPKKDGVLEKSNLPNFRKNIYTKEIIDFILELIQNGKKSKLQIIEEYRIPKTTLYKWISKYNNQNTDNYKS